MTVVQTAADLHTTMRRLGERARVAAHQTARAETVAKNTALRSAANLIRANTPAILAANASDLAAARAQNLGAALIDRLRLDEARIEAMARGLEDIANLPDPVGETIARWTRPNGLDISRVRVPLGVIGIIYESRRT